MAKGKDKEKKEREEREESKTEALQICDVNEFQCVCFSWLMQPFIITASVCSLHVNVVPETFAALWNMIYTAKLSSVLGRCNADARLHMHGMLMFGS